MAALVVNIGGTYARIAVMVDGAIFAQDRIETAPTSYEHTLGRIMRQMRIFQSQGCDFDAIGVCVAACVKEGVIVGAGNLTDWKGKNLAKDLNRSSHRPVIVMNDCQAEALGAFTSYNHPLTFVGLGTGVGVSRVVNGEATATEHGHDIIAPLSDRRCGCGGFGHVEAFLGGRSLAKWHRVEHAGLLSDQLWNEEVLPIAAAFFRNLSNDESEASRLIVIGGGLGEKQFSEEGANRLPLLRKLVGQLESTTPVPDITVAAQVDNLAMYGLAFAASQLRAA